MTFASRTEAGQRLGWYLVEQNVQADLVLGLPRGGVLVAAEVAGILKCPLDVLVVRKIGHPGHRGARRSRHERAEEPYPRRLPRDRDDAGAGVVDELLVVGRNPGCTNPLEVSS